RPGASEAPASTLPLALRQHGPRIEGIEIRADGGEHGDLRKSIVIGEKRDRLARLLDLRAETSREDLGHGRLGELPPAFLITLAPGLMQLPFNDLQDPPRGTLEHRFNSSASAWASVPRPARGRRRGRGRWRQIRGST